MNAALSGKKLSFSGINKTKKHKATRGGKKVGDSKFMETYEFELTTPPKWEHLSLEKRAEHIQDLVKSGEEKFNKKMGNRSALGIEMICKQKWTNRPKDPASRPRIKVFSLSKARTQELLEQYRTFVGIYTVYVKVKKGTNRDP
jgi:hypothetical protein